MRIGNEPRLENRLWLHEIWSYLFYKSDVCFDLDSERWL